jgi:hypothetical protein
MGEICIILRNFDFKACKFRFNKFGIPDKRHLSFLSFAAVAPAKLFSSPDNSLR